MSFNKDQIDILKSLLLGSQSNSNDQRKQSEDRLRQMREQDQISFVQVLVVIVSETPEQTNDIQRLNEIKSIRALASILFKNTLYANVYHQNGDPTFQDSVWFQIDFNLRFQMRSALLTVLGGNQEVQENKQYMKDLCLCISTIGVLEICSGEWKDFIDIMSTQAMQNESTFFKYAGIYNLGLIQESLPLKQINEHDNSQIWHTMISNIDPNNLDFTKIVAKSISQLAPSSSAHFSVQERRDKIMSSVLDLLKIDDDEILRYGIEALVEIIRINFQFMQEYLPKFFQITSSLIQREASDQRINAFSIEIWNTLFEEDINYEKNYMNQDYNSLIKSYNWKELTDLFMDCMIKFVQEDVFNNQFEEEESASIVNQCILALQFLAQIAKNDLLKYAFNHVKNFMSFIQSNSQDQKQYTIGVYSALTIVCCTIEGPSSSELFDQFQGLLEWIFESTKSQYGKIKQAAACNLMKLCQFCPDIIYKNNDVFNAYLKWYFESMEQEQDKIVVLSIKSMANLFIQLERIGINSSMNQWFPQIINSGIQKLLDKQALNDGQHIPILDAVNDIIQHSDEKGLVTIFFQLGECICSQMNQIVENQNQQYLPQEQEFLINNFGGMLQIIIVKLDLNFESTQDGKLSNEISKLLDLIAQNENCRVGVILILNGILNAIKPNSAINIADTVIQIVSHTIYDEGRKFDLACRRMAAGLIQDLATNLQVQIRPYLQNLMPILFYILQDQTVETELKTIGIMALGDICLSSEKAFQPYFETTMGLLVSAGVLSLEITQDMPFDQVKLIQDLRKALVDAFLSIINGIKSPEELPSVQNISSKEYEDQTNNQIQNIFFYIEELMNKNDLEVQNFEFIRQIVDLYSDIVNLIFNQNDEQNEFILKFQENIKRSRAHYMIQEKFQSMQFQLNSIDNGESANRFVQVVQKYVVSR